MIIGFKNIPPLMFIAVVMVLLFLLRIIMFKANYDKEINNLYDKVKEKED
jgi:hypothetical protein